jgi:hypothetical protein
MADTEYSRKELFKMKKQVLEDRENKFNLKQAFELGLETKHKNKLCGNFKGVDLAIKVEICRGVLLTRIYFIYQENKENVPLEVMDEVADYYMQRFPFFKWKGIDCELGLEKIYLHETKKFKPFGEVTFYLLTTEK